MQSRHPLRRFTGYKAIASPDDEKYIGIAIPLHGSYTRRFGAKPIFNNVVANDYLLFTNLVPELVD